MNDDVNEGQGFRLGEGNRETVRSLLRALASGFVAPEECPSEDRVIEDLEGSLMSLPSLYRGGLTLLIRGLEMAPLAMGYRKQFSGLEREDQVAVLESFEKSGNYIQRGTITSIKNLLVLSFFSQPEVEKAVGYDHRCLLDARKEGVGV